VAFAGSDWGLVSGEGALPTQAVSAKAIEQIKLGSIALFKIMMLI
jgi:hypothetical protein